MQSSCTASSSPSKTSSTSWVGPWTATFPTPRVHTDSTTLRLPLVSDSSPVHGQFEGRSEDAVRASVLGVHYQESRGVIRPPRDSEWALWAGCPKVHPISARLCFLGVIMYYCKGAHKVPMQFFSSQDLENLNYKKLFVNNVHKKTRNAIETLRRSRFLLPH